MERVPRRRAPTTPPMAGSLTIWGSATCVGLMTIWQQQNSPPATIPRRAPTSAKLTMSHSVGAGTLSMPSYNTQPYSCPEGCVPYALIGSSGVWKLPISGMDHTPAELLQPCLDEGTIPPVSRHCFHRIANCLIEAGERAAFPARMVVQPVFLGWAENQCHWRTDVECGLLSKRRFTQAANVSKTPITLAIL